MLLLHFFVIWWLPVETHVGGQILSYLMLPSIRQEICCLPTPQRRQEICCLPTPQRRPGRVSLRPRPARRPPPPSFSSRRPAPAATRASSAPGAPDPCRARLDLGRLRPRAAPALRPLLPVEEDRNRERGGPIGSARSAAVTNIEPTASGDARLLVLPFSSGRDRNLPFWVGRSSRPTYGRPFPRRVQIQNLKPTSPPQSARRGRAMRKTRAAAPAAASKPKPRARARAKPNPKAKPSPDSLPGTSSPSPSPSGSDASPSPVAVGRGFLPLASPVTPKTRSPLSASASPFPASMSTVADLRGLAASSLDSLKRRLDALHGDSVRDLEASHTRISKRIKMQTESCVQLAEEADKEQKKMVEKISERADEMKASYKKFVAEVQSSTSRVCKVTFPDMAKSAERAIDGLRTRYNIPATAA